MFQMTLKELVKAQAKAFKLLIDEAGSVSHLALMLNVPLSNVQGWAHRGRISKTGAELVEKHAVLGEKFKAGTLRPELDK